MIGMDAATGKPLTGLEHVRQSIRRIIQTQLGRRIQRRHYGTDLMSLVSAPGNPAMRLKVIGAIAGAILKWEPRVKISHILFHVDSDGRAIVKTFCSYLGEVFETDAALLGAG